MIETARLRLRPWRDEDKPAFAAIINTPAMMTHLGGVKPAAEIDALLDRQIAAERDEGFSMWAVEVLADGTLAGICGLWRNPVYVATPVGGMLEIGWRIAEPLWGTGIAREAARAALDWGWGHTDDALITAWTVAANDRSRGLMRRLGMVRRSDLDFRHPWYEAGDPGGAMIVHAVERPR